MLDQAQARAPCTHMNYSPMKFSILILTALPPCTSAPLFGGGGSKTWLAYSCHRASIQTQDPFHSFLLYGHQ